MTTSRIIALTLAILVAVAVGITPSAIQFFGEREIIRLQTKGIRLQVDDLQGSFLGASASRVESWLTIPISRGGMLGNLSLPFQVRLENVTASAGVQISALATSAKVDASVYGGKLSAMATNLITSPLISGSLEKIILNEHPQLQAFGVERGELSVTAANHPVRQVWDTDATYQLKINGLSVQPPSAVQTITGIPRLDDGQVDIRATIRSEGRLSIDSGQFDCSLGSGIVRGGAKVLSGGELEGLDLTIRVTLKGPQTSKIIGYLSLYTNQAIPSDATGFSCQIRSVPCKPGATQKNAGFCVRTACAQ